MELARLLLHFAADVNQRAARMAPLHVAAESGHLELVRLLLQEKADLEATGHKGTALQLSMARGTRVGQVLKLALTDCLASMFVHT